MQTMNPNRSPTLRSAALKEQGSLRQLFGGGRRAVRKRVGQEDELLKKNRRVIDHYLRRLGALMGKDVSLTAGVASFFFKKFVIVVEVPPDSAGLCFVYTMVCRIAAWDNTGQVLKRAMELNYLQTETRGATLGLSGEEVNLCFSAPIASLTFADFRMSLESFMQTAVEANEQLDAAKAVSAH